MATPARAQFKPIENVAAVALGSQHACARTTDRAVRCWGDNSKGQLGESTAVVAQRGDAAVVSGLPTDIAELALGSRHSCALSSAGDVYCWGAGEFGQLGNNGLASRPTPVPVSALQGQVRAIASGHSHSCALSHGG